MLLSEELFSSHEKAVAMPSVVYHYCSMASFLSILKTNSLRLSNITKSNDPTEITNVIPVLKEVTKDVLTDYNKQMSTQYQFADNTISLLIDRFFEDLSKNFYVICFSEKRDLLSQWDRYADNAKGVAIGFNTRHFVKLQIETGSQYIFGKIIYDQNVLVRSVEHFLRHEIDKKWRSCDDLHNMNLIENVTTNLVCTILQFSVLFKDEFFLEENEWRLVYNPLGRIRRLGYASAYHDRLLETDQYRHEQSGFTRTGYQFVVKGNSISSYVDLSFESIRDALIQEIIIGPKSSLRPDDKDLQLFLAFHGYRISKLAIEGKLVLSKSDRPFQ
jgi:hypothetical protein